MTRGSRFSGSDTTSLPKDECARSVDDPRIVHDRFPARRYAGISTVGRLVHIAVRRGTVGLAIAGLALAVTGCAAPPRQIVFVAGPPISKSDSFELAGSYSIEWAALSRALPGCRFDAFLNRLDGPEVGIVIGMHRVYGVARDEGKQTATDLPAGVYYIEAPSGCGWEILFRPTGA